MLKKMMKTKKLMVLSLTVLMGISIAGCSNGSAASESNSTASETSTTAVESNTITDEPKTATDEANTTAESTGSSNTEAGAEATTKLSDLNVAFGYEGESFVIKLYNNDTAAEIAKDVGSADWNLPIYHFDDFENSNVMQYYDISDSYAIPSIPETITSEKAGEVYYSDPNRIILFYQDAEVTGEYTKVGYIEDIDGLNDAVLNNPVIEGWGNKIVSISRGK